MKRSRNLVGQHAWGGTLLGALLLVGCGGTNPQDSTNPYNRSGNYQNNLAPGGIDPKATSPNEIVSVAAILPADQDVKRIQGLFAGFKKMGNPPRRVFLIGATAKNIDPWVVAAKSARLDLYPTPGTLNAVEWKAILVKCGRTKNFGNGPSVNKPNIDDVTSDQSQLTSSFTLDDVRFLVVNTETPIAKLKPNTGAVPVEWLNRQIVEAQKNGGTRHVVIFGNHPFVESKEGSTSFGIINTKEFPLFDRASETLVKNNKVRAYYTLGADSGKAARLKDTGPFLASISPERAYFLQVLKGGSLKVDVQAVGEDPTKTWTSVETVSLYEPTVANTEFKGRGPAEPAVKPEPGKKEGDPVKPPISTIKG